MGVIEPKEALSLGRWKGVPPRVADTGSVYFAAKMAIDSDIDQDDKAEEPKPVTMIEALLV